MKRFTSKTDGDILFSCRAADLKKDIYTKHVYADDKKIFTTDDIRIHATLNNNRLDYGEYEIVKRTKSELLLVKSNEELTCPLRAINDLLNCDASSLRKFTYENTPMRYAEIIRAMEENTTIQYPYFLEAIEGMTRFSVEPKKPVILTNGAQIAVIMYWMKAPRIY